jgi:homoserine dehydrogenase
MSHYRLALLGFGNVGRAFARLLLQKQDEISTRYDLTFSVTGIATGKHGSVIAPDGLNLVEALQRMETGASLNALTISPEASDNFEFLHRCNAQVLFENTPVDHESGQPAIEHIRQALQLGMHVVTANKGPVVHAYQELNDLARVHNRKFLFESTVMDGAPIFSLFRETLPGAVLRSFRGILNSTTNLILMRMESGESFQDAVKYAQSIGIAETDPSGDVDGWDAAIKVAALVTVLMGAPLKPQQVERQGIRSITPAQIMAARAGNNRWKLVCSAWREGQNIHARVRPEIVPSTSPLYNMEGTSSLVEFETDVLGLLSICETNPGPETTAYGLLADFINAVRPFQARE